MARKMKDSGIEWIGEIPEDWEIGKISQLYFERKTKVNDRDFPPLSVTMKGIMPQLSTAAKSDAHDDRKLLCIGDFAINSRSDRRGSCGISQYDGSVSLINIVLTPKVLLNSSFYDWLFHTSMFSDEFYKWGHGIVDDLWTTNWQDMKKIQIPILEIAVQHRIADFLDQKCAQIDEILQKTRDTIAEYKKLKQSIITQAVTKGVRGKRLMKDSGIEWIGEIPEEWEIARLKRDFSFGKGLPITKDNLIENGLAVISYGQIHSKHNTGVRIYNDLIRYVSNDYIKTNSSSLVHKGDFIFADTSEDLDGCGNCVYVDRQLQLFAGYHTIILFSKNDLCNKYLAYLFKTDQWRSQIRSRVSGVKLFSISRKILANATIIFPALDEQQEIALYLDEKCAEIDTLIEKKEQLVNEQESYKKSLIYEYVTGKKEVVI